MAVADQTTVRELVRALAEALRSEPDVRVRLRYRLDQNDEAWGIRIGAYQYALLNQQDQEIVTGTHAPGSFHHCPSELVDDA